MHLRRAHLGCRPYWLSEIFWSLPLKNSVRGTLLFEENMGGTRGKTQKVRKWLLQKAYTQKVADSAGQRISSWWWCGVCNSIFAHIILETFARSCGWYNENSNEKQSKSLWRCSKNHWFSPKTNVTQWLATKIDFFCFLMQILRQIWPFFNRFWPKKPKFSRFIF